MSESEGEVLCTELRVGKKQTKGIEA